MLLSISESEYTGRWRDEGCECVAAFRMQREEEEETVSHWNHGVGHHHHHVLLHLHLVVSMVTQFVLAIAFHLLPNLLSCFLEQHLLLLLPARVVLVVLVVSVVLGILRWLQDHLLLALLTPLVPGVQVLGRSLHGRSSPGHLLQELHHGALLHLRQPALRPLQPDTLLVDLHQQHQEAQGVGQRQAGGAVQHHPLRHRHAGRGDPHGQVLVLHPPPALRLQIPEQQISNRAEQCSRFLGVLS